MYLTLDSINRALWILFVASFAITALVHKARVNNWRKGVDVRVTGSYPFRPANVRNKDIFFDGAIYVLAVFDLALFIGAVMTIPYP